ncbi:MAG: thiopeptide-type bacteriocin biosynthesis protein [Hyphomicrobiales bacterium]
MSTQRTFIIGDEWLYYKIYCGPKTGDRIISEVLAPIGAYLKQQGIIDRWFFIRYADPKTHIRGRFHIKDLNRIQIPIMLMNQHLRPFIDSELVYKVMIDSYQREIERYGKNSIEPVEDVFHHDSAFTGSLLTQIEGDQGEKVRWLMGMRSIDALLEDFGYSLEQKFEMITIMKDSFAREYHMNKALKGQINNKYRADRKLIETVMNKDNDSSSEYLPILQLLNIRSESSKDAIKKILVLRDEGKLEKPLNEYMWSYLHMLNNRLFKSKQRTHELVIYCLLHSSYRATIGKQEAMKKKKEKVTK